MRTLRILLLALIVLLAQSGAQAHAYSHLGAGGDARHHAHPAPCASCSAFAPLLATAGSSAHPAVLAVAARACPPLHRGAPLHRSPTRTAYRSRAPPVQ